MATNDAVPAGASTTKLVESLWFRFVVRAALVLLALWILSFGVDRLEVFVRHAAGVGRYDDSMWLAWFGATIAAGFLFGLATWVPFTSVRFLPSRLLLAVVLLLPIARFWWIFLQGHGSGSWLAKGYWFDGMPVQWVLAAFVGVAIASGFRPKLATPAPE